MKTRPPEIIRDAAVLAGAVAVVTGLALAWAPLAWITGGALLVGLGILWQLDSDRRKAIQAERDRTTTRDY